MSRETLSEKQVGRLLVGITVGGTILTLPSVAAKAFGTAAWWVLIGFGLVFIIGGWLTARLVEKFPDETLVEFGPRLLGKPLGIVLNLFLILVFFSIVPLVTRLMVEITNIAVLPFGPSWFISGFFLLAVVYGVAKGLDTFVQVNEILVFISIAIGATVVLLGWQNFNKVHLLPLFYVKEFNLKNPSLFLGPALAFFGYPILFYLAPYIRGSGKITGQTVRSLVFVTILYSFFTLTVLGVFGVQETINQGWPALELAKSVNMPGIFLERLDLVLILSWIPALYTTAAASFFFGVLGLVRTFKLQKYASWFIWSLAIIFFFASGRLTNYFVWNKVAVYIGLVGMTVSLVYPLLLWFAYLLRPRAAEQRKGEKS